MKVSQVIRILTDNYELDDNIIIDWIGHEMYDEETDEKTNPEEEPSSDDDFEWI